MDLQLIRKLKERKLVQWALVYLAGAWLLLQVADVLAGAYDVPRPLLRALPVLLGAGLLAVLVLAWYHGERGRQRVGAMELLMLACILGIAGVAAIMIARAPADSTSDESPFASRSAIAVLPLQDLGTGSGHSYLAAGLHDELLTQLARVAALKVISRTSVLGYADGKTPIRQIARELGVGSVLEGSVQLVDGRLRVNVQLIDAATDAHLWAGSYDRTLDDGFGIQSEVAQKVVTAVGATLSAPELRALERPPTQNPEAYRLYLQGRQHHLAAGYTRRNFEMAIQFFERALALDPRFAQARAALADAHLALYGLRLDPSPARMAIAQREAEAALKESPNLFLARMVMATIHARGGDVDRGLRELEHAARSLPSSAEAWNLRSLVELQRGNWDASVAALLRAHELNPRDANTLYELGTTEAWRRNYARSVRYHEEAHVLVPDFHIAAMVRGWSYVLWQGHLDTLRAVIARSPDDPSLEAYGGRAGHEAQLLFWARDSEALLRLASGPGPAPYEAQPFYWPRALYRAWAHRLRGDDPAANAEFATALAVVDSALAGGTDDFRVRTARGVALAGLGRTDEAHVEAERIRHLVHYQASPFWRPLLAEGRARILAQIGAVDEAVAELELLLANPGFFSIHSLRLDPLYDPIRETGAVQRLLEQYLPR
jgi:TolB-like protein/Flp pilus assembly protein TadD